MADEKPKNEEGPPAAFLARGVWPFVSMAAGLVVLVIGLALWKGPISFWQTRRATNDFENARIAFEDKRYSDAIPLLESVRQRLWRVPHKAGDTYFALGACYLAIADEAAPMDKEGHWHRAIAYLNEAALHDLSADDELTLPSLLGRARQRIGDDDKALDEFDRGLRWRRRLAALLHRRELEWVLSQPSVDLKSAHAATESLKDVSGLPDHEAAAIQTLVDAASKSDWNRARELLSDPHQRWLDHPVPQAIELIDLNADTLLSVEPLRAGEFINKQLSDNRSAMSSLLAMAFDSALKVDPPLIAMAKTLGKERLALPGASRAELDETRLKQAVLLLNERDPIAARALLDQIDPQGGLQSEAQCQRARSYLEEARRLASTSVNAWLNSDPKLRRFADFTLWVGRQRRGTTPIVDRRPADKGVDQGGAPSEPSPTPLLQVTTPGPRGLPPWLRAVDPAALKRQRVNIAFRRAIDGFKKVLEDTSIDNEEEYARALLGLAEAHRMLDQHAASIEDADRVIRGFPGTIHHQAAALQKARSMIVFQPDRIVEAFRFFEATLSKLDPARNPHFTIDEALDAFRDGWRTLHDGGRYGDAVELARLYSPHAPLGVASYMIGQSSHALAMRDWPRARQVAALQGDHALADVRARFREAGDRFFETTRLKPSAPQFMDILQLAVQDTLEGQSFDQAAERASAWIEAARGTPMEFDAVHALVKAEMGRRRYEEARTSLDDLLVRLGRSPERFEGRISLAECHVELARAIDPNSDDSSSTQRRNEHYQAAETLLRKNTDGLDQLEPTAIAWRRSLFALGKLMQETGRPEEAIARFREAVRRYPDGAEVTEALYRIADCQRQAARRPGELMRKETTPRGRAFYLEEKRRWLAQSLDQFSALIRMLVARQEKGALTLDEARLLRSAVFAIGSVQSDLEDWPAAIAAYTSAASRYQDRADCLAAYVQIANAYWKTDRPSDALSTLRQARWVLSQLGAESFRDSALTKDEWSRRLGSLVGDQGRDTR